MEDNKIRVIFVCTGNICRSPMAEAVFEHLVREAGLDDHFEIDSAGTSTYHIGEKPHIGTQQILKKYHISLNHAKRAERVDRNTIDRYDYIIAMDSGHAAALKTSGNVHRLLEFAPQVENKDVPDPYYDNNFEEVYTLVLKGCEGLLEHIRHHDGI